MTIKASATSAAIPVAICVRRLPTRASSPAVEKRLGPDHLPIAKRVLVNGGDAKDAPTASNITDAVGLLRQARETDTVVLFIAAHRINKGPTDAARMDGAMRGSTVVPMAGPAGGGGGSQGTQMPISARSNAVHSTWVYRKYLSFPGS